MQAVSVENSLTFSVFLQNLNESEDEADEKQGGIMRNRAGSDRHGVTVTYCNFSMAIWWEMPEMMLEWRGFCRLTAFA